MSLSRDIALAANDPEKSAEKLNQIFTAIAANILSAGGDRDKFKAFMRREFRALHRGGWPKDRLRELMQTAMVAFHAERERQEIDKESPSSSTVQDLRQKGLPAEKYVK
jgi:hypothetical protein